MADVFFVFRDSGQRRRALAAEPGSAERYALFGLDQLAARGLSVGHNFERRRGAPLWARSAGAVLDGVIGRMGGCGGDFAIALASLRAANRARVVFSTVDTVGLPLVLLKRAGLLRPPLVYAAIGLPERLRRLRSSRMRRLYAAALGSSAALVAYSRHEADDLTAWLERNGAPSARVEFVPFGVDPDGFAATTGAPSADVVSVGADPHRDFELLMRVARRMPDVSFRVVTSEERSRTFEAVPANLTVEADLPFDEMRRRLAGARLVALPVHENSYSGATTVLLQAMSLGKPVVVTRTSAIATGYGLVDGENCRLVAPGDDEGLERALGDVLRDDFHARALGASARATVERELTWERYVDRIEALLRDAAGELR